MATATAEDRIVTRLAAITVLLTDPQRQAYRERWEARAAQLAERPDPVEAPPAGTWMRGSFDSDRWHLSSGIAEQPFNGALHGWFLVVPACNRRYDIHVTTPSWHPESYQGTGSVTVGKPGSPRCERCSAIEAGIAKPAHWQEVAS
jgi:hypothetical protein